MPAISALGLIAGGSRRSCRPAPPRATRRSTRRCCRCWPTRFRSSGPATSTAWCCTTATSWPTCRGCGRGHSRWSSGAGLSGSLPYGGVCDVHRLQVRVATDDYRELEDRLVNASRALEDVNIWAAAEGFYQLGEVRRLLGDHDGALAAFAQDPRSSGWTRNPARHSCGADRAIRRRRGPRCGSRWPARIGWSGSGCCVPPSRSRSAATALTRPKVTAVNWNPVRRPSTRQVFGPGLRTRGERCRYVGESSGRRW